MAEDKVIASRRWQDERTAAWLQRAVAAAEPKPQRAKLFNDLAGETEAQAAILEKNLGIDGMSFQPGARARVVARLIRLWGPMPIRPILAAMKVRGISVYSGGSIAEHGLPTNASEIGARHRGSSGGTLRAAVFGVNDGLISNTCLILGVAGSAASPEVILVSGVAGLLAGAFSMAAGEYISMLSQREMFEYQIDQERDEIERYPEAEAEELALIYAARGVPIDDARRMTARLLQDKQKALDTFAREELGLNPDDLGSPLGAAASSFLAFAAGAILPLLPFLVAVTQHRVLAASLLSGVALLLIGAVLSLFSGRSAVLGGLRMLAIGSIAATATYGIGRLFGVEIS